MPTEPDAKSKALREHSSLNPHPEAVTDSLFQNSPFFDARDLVLVKYEMLRPSAHRRFLDHRSRHPRLDSLGPPSIRPRRISRKRDSLD